MWFCVVGSRRQDCCGRTETGSDQHKQPRWTTAVHLTGLVCRWPNTLRWLHRQLDPCMAGLHGCHTMRSYGWYVDMMTGQCQSTLVHSCSIKRISIKGWKHAYFWALVFDSKTGQDCVVCQVNQKSTIVGSFMKSYCNHHNYSTSIIFTYILPICILSVFLYVQFPGAVGRIKKNSETWFPSEATNCSRSTLIKKITFLPCLEQ